MSDSLFACVSCGLTCCVPGECCYGEGCGAKIPPTDVRVMDIPPNRVGLGEGLWFRWPELGAWLRAEGYGEVADKLEGVRDAESVATREFTVRR